MLLTSVQVGKLKICDACDSWRFGNRVGDLFNSIRRHQLVHWFDLQGCMLGSDRARKGLETLQTVKSLETLDLQDNLIDRTCLPAIAEFLRASNVKHLYLQGNSLFKYDFDELETVVSKLGRECTVYCYKDKEQPMRKLICTTVKLLGGFDESLSFSSAQLNNIFQRYKDRAAFVENAAAADEIVYTHTVRPVVECCEDPPSIASLDVAASIAAKPLVIACSATGDTVQTTASLSEVLCVDTPPDSIAEHSHESAIILPSISSSKLLPPAAPLSTGIDTIVAMGFQREAAEAAYAKCGRDVQVCSELSPAAPFVIITFFAACRRHSYQPSCDAISRSSSCAQSQERIQECSDDWRCECWQSRRGGYPSRNGSKAKAHSRLRR
jgi:hypothetical protein